MKAEMKCQLSACLAWALVIDGLSVRVFSETNDVCGGKTIKLNCPYCTSHRSFYVGLINGRLKSG